MTPERWQKLDRLFHTALDCTPDQRSAFLDQACAGDLALRRQVDALLLASSKAGSFIDAPALELEARALAGDAADMKVRIGSMIGHYRVIEPLGSGGMGEVYLAQDTILRRQVALKLLPTHFTENPERLQRFEQ